MKDLFDFLTLDFFGDCTCSQRPNGCASNECRGASTSAPGPVAAYVPVTRKVTLTNEKTER